MQGKFALKYLHLRHTFLHLHLISLEHASAAPYNDIHFGTHSRRIFSQTQELGVGISGLGMQLFARILACNAVLITWRYNASCVGGKFSRFRLLRQNISRHASFTFSWILTRSYKTIINVFIISNCQNCHQTLKSDSTSLKEMILWL